MRIKTVLKNQKLCLFALFRPTREFFTHMVMSPLPVKGFKFRPMLGRGTHGFWAVWVHLLWHEASVYNDHRQLVFTRTFSSGDGTTCFYDLSLSWLGVENPIWRLQRNALIHCFGTGNNFIKFNKRKWHWGDDQSSVIFFSQHGSKQRH